MIKHRPANTRGITKTSWIVSRRTFSNNQYWNPKFMNWGPVKVINDDILQPQHTVPNHQHKNYDILGYLVEGELEHRDSLGNVVRASHPQIQHMWCGRSIWHTESCVSTTPARYLQIWITPKDEHRDTKPYYECITKSPEFSTIPINYCQDITIRAGILTGQHTHTINSAYLYVVSGTVSFANGVDTLTLVEGDGCEIHNQEFTADYNAHILLFQR